MLNLMWSAQYSMCDGSNSRFVHRGQRQTTACWEKLWKYGGATGTKRPASLSTSGARARWCRCAIIMSLVAWSVGHLLIMIVVHRLLTVNRTSKLQDARSCFLRERFALSGRRMWRSTRTSRLRGPYSTQRTSTGTCTWAGVLRRAS